MTTEAYDRFERAFAAKYTDACRERVSRGWPPLNCFLARLTSWSEEYRKAVPDEPHIVSGMAFCKAVAEMVKKEQWWVMDLVSDTFFLGFEEGGRAWFERHGRNADPEDALDHGHNPPVVPPDGWEDMADPQHDDKHTGGS